MGGPMMGIALASTEVPLVKNNNGILAFTEAASALPAPTACIRCARCLAACPMGLSPVTLAKAVERGDRDALAANDLLSCMECGSCAYLCPANRPLVQNMRIGKALLRESAAKKG